MAVEIVDAASSEQCDAVFAALTLAFARDPVMRWMFSEPAAYLEHFPPFARAFGGRSLEAGACWASDDGSGAGLWLPSGVHADGDAIGEAIFGGLDPAKRGTSEAMLEKMDAFHPEEPHWYLAIIGVDSAHQGRGLGAQLMQAALARCDEEGLIAYLESSNPANISLYERHGFEVVGKIEVGDAPVVTPMLRPAR